MKLITEISEVVESKIITEEKNGEKNYFIEGIFMQSECPNRNGRKYPKGILENELNRYLSLINEKRSLGELGHPDTPTINLDKVSHLITNLRFEGNDIIGRAKIMDTPMGKIAKTFINEGVRLGVSSRGVGSLRNEGNLNIVQPDFRLSTIDIVSDPSAPNAFVRGIMENEEWMYIDGKGWINQFVDESKNSIRKANKREIEAVSLIIFENFLKQL